jgi:hypothetical protein
MHPTKIKFGYDLIEVVSWNLPGGPEEIMRKLTHDIQCPVS